MHKPQIKRFIPFEARINPSTNHKTFNLKLHPTVNSMAKHVLPFPIHPAIPTVLSTMIKCLIRYNTVSEYCSQTVNVPRKPLHKSLYIYDKLAHTDRGGYLC